MYSEIIAIAPLNAMTETNVTLENSNDTWSYFQALFYVGSSLKNYVPICQTLCYPNGNDTQRLTYDGYFAEKFYSDYLLGDSNMNNRMLLQYLVDPDKIRKEQKRIETELLNFEQDSLGVLI